MWLCIVMGTGQAQEFDRLYANSAPLVLDQPLQWVAVPTDSVNSPDELASGQAFNFQPYTAGMALPTSDRQDVWVRFSMPATESLQTWFIRIPRQTLIKGSLFSRDERGNWQGQHAGEAIAPEQWSLRTRVPSFDLRTYSEGPATYYLRFKHRSPVTERPMLLTPVEYIDGASRVGIVIGLMWGVFGLLAVLSLTALAVVRSGVFLWLGVFVLMLMITQLVLIGYGSWRVWPQSVHLNQVMGWVCTALTIASASWFFAKASYARESHPHIYGLLAAVTACSLLVACLMAFNRDLIPRSFRNLWVAAAIVSITASLLWMWLRGQSWNLFLLLGAAPIGLASLARLAYNIGWIAQVEWAQAASVLSATLGSLFIFLALAWRSRATFLATERAAALVTYDPVTGLMLPHVIDTRLPLMLLRASRFNAGCGVLMLRWLNPAPVKTGAANEQRAATLSRIGNILRGVARDVDTIARHGENRFIMLVEAPISRTALAETSTRILAASMRSSTQPSSGPPIELHIAILHAASGSTMQDVIKLLKHRLRQMPSGTRRRVQFVDAATDGAISDGEDPAGLRKEDLLAKINAIEKSQPLPPIAAARRAGVFVKDARAR